MFANCDSIEDNTRYFFYLINRPILVLKCDQGFVGYKAGSVKLECNKASYETIQVERVENGLVHFKGEIRQQRTSEKSEQKIMPFVLSGQNGKYWHAHNDGISCDSEVGQGFYLELREPTRMCIKTASGQYVVAAKNGGFATGSTDPEAATRWEY